MQDVLIKGPDEGPNEVRSSLGQLGWGQARTERLLNQTVQRSSWRVPGSNRDKQTHIPICLLLLAVNSDLYSQTEYDRLFTEEI